MKRSLSTWLLAAAAASSFAAEAPQRGQPGGLREGYQELEQRMNGPRVRREFLDNQLDGLQARLKAMGFSVAREYDLARNPVRLLPTMLSATQEFLNAEGARRRLRIHVTIYGPEELLGTVTLRRWRPGESGELAGQEDKLLVFDSLSRLEARTRRLEDIQFVVNDLKKEFPLKPSPPQDGEPEDE